MNHSKESKGYVFILFLARFIFTWLCLIFFRILFLGKFYHSDFYTEQEGIVDSLLLGARFDLKLAALIFVPLTIIYLFFSINKKKREVCTTVYLAIIGLPIGALYYSDFLYFAYLKSRLNASILTFSNNSEDSLKMISESYNLPLAFVTVLLLLITYLGVSYALNLILSKFKIEPSLSKIQKRIAVASIIASLSLSIYGSFSYYPLRWSQAFQNEVTVLSNLSLNPVLYFIDTLKFKEADYNLEKVSKLRSALSKRFQYENSKLDSFRILTSKFKDQEVRPNIIVIVLESMAAYKTMSFGNKLNPTPSLDSLIKDSIFFKNFYTTSTATARSIFSSITGLADVSKVKTGSRNPLMVNQHSLLNYMKDYEKYYFIGGNANWGNIKGVLKNNIKDLKLYEEANFESPHNDVWGISDYNLFKESFSILNNRNSERPFFALIQTAGFHRPYTIPEGDFQFEVKTMNEKDLKKYGFISNEEYNSLRFQDFALGSFISKMSKSSMFKNTVFLIYGDHGLPHNNAVNVSKWNKNSIITDYHVPLIIYSPHRLKPEHKDDIASLSDIMPTVLDLAGYDGKTRTFGSSLFNEDREKFAFSFSWFPPHYISYIDKDFYIQKIPNTENGLLNLYRSETPLVDIKKDNPEKYNELSTLLDALYEKNKYILYHNDADRDLR